MDFLDPRKRRAHRRRLVFGYALMAILIAIGTMVLLYLSYGYDVDRKTGELIQNGIVFVDSQPQGASVYLDDVLQPNTTDARLDIPAGTYTVRLERDGYRGWQRTFNIEGGQFQRLVYPLLIPNVLETSDVLTYDSLPQLATQSPDRRWLLVQRPGTVYQFDLFDLNNPDDASETVQIPIGLLTSPSTKSTLEFVEWSNDNRHLVFKRSFDKKTEYILFDRENPDESININTTMGINPALISLKNKRPDQLYYLDTKPGVLRIANINNKTISAPLANAVHEYSTYGDELVLLATTDGTEKDKAEIRILEKSETFTLREVSKSDRYVLDLSRYDNQWYYVVGSSADNQTLVYEDPLRSLKSNDSKPLEVVSLLGLDNPRYTSFSANTQFVIVQSGNKISVLDLYDSEQYSYELKHNIDIKKEIEWMDGHRLVYVVNNQSYIIDFDGSNENTLVTSMGVRPYFDRDYDNVFTLEGSKADPAKQALTITKLLFDQ